MFGMEWMRDQVGQKFPSTQEDFIIKSVSLLELLKHVEYSLSLAFPPIFCCLFI